MRTPKLWILTVLLWVASADVRLLQQSGQNPMAMPPYTVAPLDFGSAGEVLATPDQFTDIPQVDMFGQLPTLDPIQQKFPQVGPQSPQIPTDWRSTVQSMIVAPVSDVPDPYQSKQFQTVQKANIAKWINSGDTAIGQSKTETCSPSLDGVSYQKIKLNGVNQKYLFFYLTSETDPNDVLQLKIYDSQQKLNTLLVCQTDNKDSCYIETNRLQPNQVLIASITCSNPIKYTLSSQWSDLQHIKPGSEVKFIFGPETNQLFHLQLQGIDYYELRLHMYSQLTKQFEKQCKIYGRYGESRVPSKLNYDFKSFGLWQDGQGYFIKKRNVKDPQINILLTGSANTIYIFKVDLLTKENHEVAIDTSTYEYLDAGEAKVYHMSFETKHEGYSLKVSTFMGETNLEIYQDEKLSKKMETLSFEYMQDFEYMFEKATLLKDGINEVFIRVEAPRYDAVTLLQFEGRKAVKYIELKEGVFQFMGLQTPKTASYSLTIWANKDTAKVKEDPIQLDVEIVELVGQATPDFRLCPNPHCVDFNELKKINLVEKRTLGRKTTYTIQIDPQSIKFVENIMQKRGTLLIELTGASVKNIEVRVAVEIVGNRNLRYLREGRSVEDHIRSKEVHHYKYLTEETQITAIKIYLSTFEGKVQFEGSRVDLRDKDAQRETLQVKNQVIEITERLNSAVFIKVIGLQPSSFSIIITIVRKMEAISLLTNSEENPLQLILAPSQVEYIQLKPRQPKAELTYQFKATHPIEICHIKAQMKCAFEIPLTFEHGFLNLVAGPPETMVIRVHNPTNKNIEFSGEFHSGNDKRCVRHQVNSIFGPAVYSAGSCISFQITNLTLGVKVGVLFPQRKVKSDIKILLCSRNYDFPLSETELIIPSGKVSEYCTQNSDKSLKIFFLTERETNKTIRGFAFMQIQYQPLHILADTPYLISGVSGEFAVQVMVYKLINIVDTRILITERVGNIEIYASILDEKKLIIPRKRFEYALSSKSNVNVYGMPFLTVTATQIKANGCSTCYILIAVYGDPETKKQVSGVLQIQHESTRVFANKPSSQYIFEGQKQFFSFQSPWENSTSVMIRISDNDQGCTKIEMYLKTNSGSNKTQSQLLSQVNNDLIFITQPKQQVYQFSVEGVFSCAYDLYVNYYLNHISVLTPGKVTQARLDANQVEYFFLTRHSNESFKIISFARFGEVQFYLNRSVSIQNYHQLDINSFELRSAYNNAVEINDKMPIFCGKCEYIVAARAVKSTATSLMVIDSESTVTLTSLKIFNDYFQNKDDVTMALYRAHNKVKLAVKVFSGSLNISFSSSLEGSKNNYSFAANLQMSYLDLEYHVPLSETDNPTVIYFNISANSPSTRYSIEVLEVQTALDQSTSIHYEFLTSGRPNHFDLTYGKVACLKGFLRSDDQELFIGTDLDHINWLQYLKIQMKVDSKVLQFTTQHTKNMFRILPKQLPKNIFIGDFEICVKLFDVPKTKEELNALQSEDDSANNEDKKFNSRPAFADEILKLVFMQIDSVNIIFENTLILYTGPRKFAIETTQPFFVDLFGCNADANLYKVSTLDTSKQSGLAEPLYNHAYMISSSGTTFVEVSGDAQSIKWQHVDEENGVGIGYLKFMPGQLSYSSKYGYITIDYQPLKQLSDTKATVVDVIYRLVISNDTQALRKVTECQYLNEPYVVVIQILREANVQKTTRSYAFTLSKNDIMSNFKVDSTIPDSLAVSIVAELTLRPGALLSQDQSKNRNVTENYRFIYPKQTLPKEVFNPSSLEQLSPGLLSLIVVLTVGGVIIITYLITRKIVPMLARLKDRQMAEENDHANQSIPLPQASDRPGQTEPAPPSTDDALK